MKIGLYFGSFNPIHTGHLIIASHVLNNCNLDRIWFVVSPQNPFKDSSTLLNEYDRLHLVDIAVKDNDRFAASNIEFRLPKPSYTIDTLTYLKEKHPNDMFSLVMGSDGYQNIDKWKNGNIILKDYPIIVYQRPGHLIEKRSSKTTVLEAPLLEISSTFIRKSVSSGKSIRYLVPEAVRAEIERNNYYSKYNSQ